MKHVIPKLLAMLLLITLVGCGNSTQDAILKYVNEDLITMVNIESEMLNSYNSVTGDQYTDDLAMHTEFTENTLVLAKKLHEEAVHVSSQISDQELLAVHNLYVSYCETFINALNTIASALESQDSTEIMKGYATLEEANNIAANYQQEIRKLAENNNIILE